MAGTPANELARTYLETQLRLLGYETQREPFTYPRFDDLGSGVTTTAGTVSGLALEGSAGGSVSGAVVNVPEFGTSAGFARVDVKGKLAVVARGRIPFLEKAENAQRAGATGLIILNSENQPLRGRLTTPLAFPVLGVPAGAAEQLGDGQDVTLNVRVQQTTVQAQNLIAYKKGVTRPEVLFGAHLDSVPGAPGANDNLSGTLTVLELARQTVNTPLSARTYFVLFDGEENGLLGAKHFTGRHPALLGGLKAMLNFDMVGVDVQPLQATGSRALVNAAQAVSGVDLREGQESGSDHVPFQQQNVPVLFFHRGLDANYHQPGDRVLDPQLIRATVAAGLEVAQAVLAQQGSK
ncbi:M28 family peptidase [Deinococcus cavernae]|uniref:M28 family peptidase n=1 Tax=Deinococcus cavernae TaxID=2320857 RepID=A0A418VA85_9DEIO|nr:M28 family peptidase [Deinococcus cavernae]RJF72989.1 M28 family peptidase [Deinococcus cavernae]